MDAVFLCRNLCPDRSQEIPCGGFMNPGDTNDLLSMNQVRDLLFGAQLRDIETRFQRQEARFQREVNDAREALKTRLDSLENFMNSEVASLMNRIASEAAERELAWKSEQRERGEAFNTMIGNLAGAEKAFERRLAGLATTINNIEHDIRRLLQTETGALNNKIDEKYAQALSVLSDTAAQIRQDMVYRSTLSSILTEMALKMASQWTSELLEVPAISDVRNDSHEQHHEHHHEHHQPEHHGHHEHHEHHHSREENH